MNYCSKGKENCKTCTKETYDKWNKYLSTSRVEFNPWVLYNEKLVDFVRWREVGALGVIFSFSLGILGPLGILSALAIYYLTGTLEGGSVGDAFGDFPRQEPKILSRKCALHENCRFTRKTL